MANIFQNVVGTRAPRNNFNLSHEHLTTGKIGSIIPIDVIPVTPLDRFQDVVSFVMKFEPLVAPTMARMNVAFHAFYVPHRLITPQSSRQSTWENFIEKIGANSIDRPELPRIYTSSDLEWSDIRDDDYGMDGAVASELSIGSLWDYMKLPSFSLSTGDSINENSPAMVRLPSKGVSALPFLAYQLIYDDFYRRDQIQSRLAMPIDVRSFDLVDGGELNNWKQDDLFLEQNPDSRRFNIHELLALRYRNWERDYFNSALPEPQYGEDVLLGDGRLSFLNDPSLINGVSQDYNGVYYKDIKGYLNGDVSFYNDTLGPTSEYLTAQIQPNAQDSFTRRLGAADRYILNKGSFGGPFYEDELTANNALGPGADFKLRLQDLQDAAQGTLGYRLTVNDIRFGIQQQGIREKVNRGGTRYIEIMKTFYNVDIPDLRISRPQFLGGLKFPVYIGDVIQTSETQDTPQGTLTGKAVSGGSGQIFKNSPFAEHGYVVVTMSVTPRVSYEGGIPRYFMHENPEDFFLYDYDHLGDQPIYTSELYQPILRDGAAPFEDFSETEFGYAPRYAEYKSAYSSVTGEFRESLDGWVITRQFADEPKLSEEFIRINSNSIDHIFEFQNIEGTSNNHFKVQVNFNLIGKRSMSKYSTPFTLW